MTVPTFTLKGSALDLLDYDEPAPLESITLTPNTRGQVVSIAGVLYRPEPITIELDEDGKINGDDGIELLANDDDVELDEPLQWQIQINTTAGFPRKPKAFWFQAALDGETVLLGDVSVSPMLAAQGVSRGPRGVDDVVASDGSIQFQFRGEPVGDPISLDVPVAWDDVTGKPAIIAAGSTQAAARTAIGAGTSDLTLGSTSTTAKRGDYAPSSVEVTTALGFTPENAANRNAPNGYAGLDSSGLVPSVLLPGFVDDVIEAANVSAFATTGTAGKLYVAIDTGRVYRWSGSTYIEVSPSPGSTDAVAEGSVNLYHTDARAQAALAAQLSAKEPTIPAGTTSQYYRGDKTFQTLDKSAVGLASVDNTSDSEKPVSTATQTALNGKLGIGDTAAAATKLAAARNISGVPFDGTADIDPVSAATVGPAYYTPGYVAGSYYFCASSASAGTGTQSTGVVRVYPWIVTAAITVDRLFAEFTAAGDAASVYRIGIWSHNSAAGKPGALVLDAGTISTGSGNAGTVATGGTPGTYELTVSQQLSPGVYWVGGAVQGVTSTQPTMRTIVVANVPMLLPIGTSLPGNAATHQGFFLGSQTGAFGSLASASVSTGGTAPVRIGFRVA